MQLFGQMLLAASSLVLHRSGDRKSSSCPGATHSRKAASPTCPGTTRVGKSTHSTGPGATHVGSVIRLTCPGATDSAGVPKSSGAGTSMPKQWSRHHCLLIADFLRLFSHPVRRLQTRYFGDRRA